MVPFHESIEEQQRVFEEQQAVTAGGARAISRVEILLRGEHFPLENFIHSVNIRVLITKTPRISATSFSPPGGKKVSLHTYIAIFFDLRRLGATFGASPNSTFWRGLRFQESETAPNSPRVAAKRATAPQPREIFAFLHNKKHDFQAIP